MAGAGNFGDDLIAISLLKTIIKKYPHASIGLICHGESIDYKVFGDYEETFSAYVTFFPRPRVKHGLGIALSNFRRIRCLTKKADLVVIGGGGLLQDSHFQFTVHRYLRFAFVNKDAEVIIAGTGIGPLRRSSNRLYLKVVASRFSAVQVRDEYSNILFERISGRKAEVACDIISGTDLTTIGFRRVVSKRILGCSLRPWPGLDIKRVANTICRLCKAENLSCYLFVFEYTAENMSEYELALQLKKILEDEYTRVRILTYNLDPIEEFIETLSSVKKAIAMRYHANIIWQKLSVPTMPLAYAPKVTSLYYEHGVKEIATVENFRDLEHRGFVSIQLDDSYFLPQSDIGIGRSNRFIQLLVIRLFDVLDFMNVIHKIIKRAVKINGG